MKIVTLPKRAFDTWMEATNISSENVESKDYMLISIVGTCNSEPPYFKSNFENVLNLKFDDVERDMYGCLAFREEQALEIINFVNKNLHKNRCIVHCSAGVSRSGGVASFINSYLEQPDNIFQKDNPHILPNGQVIATLKKVVRDIVSQFENEYLEQHTKCPKCNGTNLNITEMYCVPNPLDLSSYEDDNDVFCDDCKHECKVHNLI